jgi:hypothetical protein
MSTPEELHARRVLKLVYRRVNSLRNQREILGSCNASPRGPNGGDAPADLTMAGYLTLLRTAVKEIERLEAEIEEMSKPNLYAEFLKIAEDYVNVDV